MFFEGEFPKMMRLDMDPFSRSIQSRIRRVPIELSMFQPGSISNSAIIRSPKCRPRKFPRASAKFNFNSTVLTESSWERNLSLDWPTKPENLKFEIVENKLKICGSSEEVEEEKDGFKVKSNHKWRRDITIPENIFNVKVTMGQNSKFLKVTGERKKQKDEDKIEE